MAQKSGLGRGLGALLPGGESVLTENGVMMASVDLVSPNPRQPRSMLRPCRMCPANPLAFNMMCALWS